MTQPLISVILNTARSNFPMIGFPNINHLFYVINSLNRQTFKDFELIISDYIHSSRKIDWKEAGQADFPIYHVPIDHSKAHSGGYCAISGGKNNGIMYSSGRYLVFLDDCCAFEKNFLFIIFNNWAQRKLFTNAFHRKEIGTQSYLNESGEQIVDCRYKLLGEQQELIDCFHMYGYSSMSIDAALKINGFDEMFDGSRQLEDIECGERLKLNGFRILLSKSSFVNEQEHFEIGKGPDSGCSCEEGKCHHWSNPSTGEDLIRLNPNLRCNGPYYYLKTQRPLENRMVANIHGLSQEEKKQIKPCYKLEGYRSGDCHPTGKMCMVSGVGCNWLDENGRLKYMDTQDFIYDNPPIFDLKNMREQRMQRKESYRVR